MALSLTKLTLPGKQRDHELSPDIPAQALNAECCLLVRGGGFGAEFVEGGGEVGRDDRDLGVTLSTSGAKAHHWQAREWTAEAVLHPKASLRECNAEASSTQKQNPTGFARPSPLLVLHVENRMIA